MRIILTIILAFAVAGGASARAKSEGGAAKRVDITNVVINSDGEQATVSFDAAAGNKAAKGTRMITITPVVTSDGERYELTPIAVQGRGSRISQARRAKASGTAANNGGALLIENGSTLSYSAQLPDSVLSAGAELAFESDVKVCNYCGSSAQTAATDFVSTRIEVVATEKPAPSKTTGDIIAQNYDFVEPLSAGPVQFTSDMREKVLIVYFHLNKFDIRKDYKDNANILNQIIAAINVIAESPDSDIRKVLLAGFASPEGYADRNAKLAAGRGEALRSYIMKETRLPYDVFVMHNGGSDWNGLRLEVEKSDIPYRAEVLDIIDNTPEWDATSKTGRMSRIMKLDNGSVYNRLKRDFFPDLRNAAYIKVYYQNK